MEEKSLQNTIIETTVNEQNTPSYKSKRKRFSKLLLFGGLLLVAVAVSIGYFTYKSLTRDNDEKSRYEALKNSRNVEDYENFLDDFPKSRYNRDVSSRLERVKVEIKEWKAIQNSSNANDFRAFRSRFNDAYFADLVENKLDSLDWIEAKREDTNRSYKIYIDQHPKGRHINEVPNELKLMQQNYIKENNTAFDFENVIYLFFQNLTLRNIPVMKQYVAEEMTNFMGKPTLKREDLENALPFLMPAKIDSCGVKVDNFSPIEKNNELYDIKFTIEQFLRDSYGGMKYVDYDVACQMNDNLEIVSMQLIKTKEQLIAKAGKAPTNQNAKAPQVVKRKPVSQQNQQLQKNNTNNTVNTNNINNTTIIP